MAVGWARSLQTVRPARGEPLATSEHGRICSAPGCATALSIYNPSSHCALHGDWSKEKAPPPRRHYGERICANPGCLQQFAAVFPRQKYCDARCRRQAAKQRTVAKT